MKTAHNLRACVLLSVSFHAALMWGWAARIPEPATEPFEVEFEAREEILPREYEITEEKKIEEEPPAPVVRPEVVEEIAEAEAVEPPRMDEETRASLLRYQDSVKQRIQQEKRYPRKALRLRREGTARVAFSLLSTGAVRGIALMGSSGAAELDAEAADAVRRAAPFAPFPRGLGEKELRFEIDIAFMITKE